MDKLELEVIGGETWRRKLKGLPVQPVKRFLTRAGEYGADQAARTLDSRIASASMQSQVGRQRSGGFVDPISSLGNVMPDAARVYSLMSKPRTASIESGRPVGEVVHTNRLVRWARRVGYGHNLFVLAQQIRRRGVRGRFFMRNAYNRVAERLPGLTRELEADIMREFDRK